MDIGQSPSYKAPAQDHMPRNRKCQFASGFRVVELLRGPTPLPAVMEAAGERFLKQVPVLAEPVIANSWGDK
jgi:hypothetical protein